MGNNWLVGLQQNQAQHPQPGQDGWNGVMGNAAAPGAPLQPRIRLINIRIPVRALVQMAVLGLVLYQVKLGVSPHAPGCALHRVRHCEF